MHTHVHGHMGTPCRYRCVSFINPMPALLAGQDRSLQLTKCPPDQGHLWVALPYQYHRSPRGQARKFLGHHTTYRGAIAKTTLPEAVPACWKNVQRLAWISCTPPIGQVLYTILQCMLGFPGGSEVKVSACNAADLGSIPGSGRSPLCTGSH